MTAGRAAPLVAHIIFRLDFGGLENGLVNLVNRMPVARYRHAIVCLTGYGEEFRGRIQRADVQVISLNKRPGKDLAVYGRMWRVLRGLRPDIVHTRNKGTVDMQWIAWAAGVPHRVHGEHGWEATDPKGQNPESLRIRRACRPAIQRYVPMSQDIARWLVRDVGVDPARIRQLYSGVDVERFKRGAESSPGLRSLGCAFAGEGERSLVIGTVGRLDAVKNQECLLRMVRAILDHDPELGRHLHLVIVGDGPRRVSLEAIARALGMTDQVWFTGSRNDTSDIMRAMDVFVLPSLNEGVSNTILEAMATGLPVVAARVGGNPELVVEGVTGALYNQRSPDALEQAVLRYLKNPMLREAHGTAGRQRVVQNFGLDAMVQGYVDLYDELLKERSRQPSPTRSGRG